MATDDESRGRLAKSARKAGLTSDQAELFAGAVAKELERGQKKMIAEINDLRNEMEKLELRLTIKLGGIAIVVGGIVIAVLGWIVSAAN